MGAALVFRSAAATVAIAAPYSATLVAASDLDGDPSTGAWSDAASYLVPLENGELDPYGSATLYIKHDGTNYYARIDGKIDVPWTSPTGNHFWLGVNTGPSTVTGHHKTGQDLIFFGETSYPDVTYPLTPIDASGSGRPPLMDTQQDAVGMLKFAGTTAPYSFTAEWRRALTTGDSQDITLLADGSTIYNLYITTDSNGGGSSGGNIDHSVVTNANTIKFQAPPIIVHDVAITSVIASTLNVARPPDTTVSLSVDLANQGTEPETFTVTAFAGMVTVGSQSASLISGATQTVPFSFDTATLADGSYLIHATTSTVAGETDTADNSFDDGTLVITTTPFDYHLTVSPTGATVKQGESTSAIVTVTLDAGFTQTVTLSATGLPSGATASFSPPSGNPTYTPTMTIATSLTTPAGTYPIQISGSPAGASVADETITFTLTVSAIVHDVAVTDVTASPLNALRPPDMDVTISVTVANMGTETETFSVRVFIGMMELPSQTVSNLASGGSAILTFTVNTSTLADGSYLIRADAVLAGDDNPANNTKDDGTLVVTTTLHDLAVTAVTPSPTSGIVGNMITVTVTVANQGTVTETAVVHTYFDSTLIGEMTGSIGAGASADFIFTWDTTGVAARTYTISGHVVPVTGETDTADNSFTDGTVTLTVPNIPPTADFVWSPMTPNVGQLVTFTSTSTDTDGTIVAYAWDFNNDGVTDATTATASYTFMTAGSKPVSLSVTDNNGASASVTKTVVVNAPPVADFTWSPMTPGAGDLVTFTSTSTDSDGTITAYAWDFNNDGVTDATTASASYTFMAAGSYPVALTVTDNGGASASVTKTVAVTAVNVQPVASFTYSPSTVFATEPVAFTSTSFDPDGSIATYAWDFTNDGITDATTPTASYTYAVAGTYTARLTVTDNLGASASTTQTITVHAEARLFRGKLSWTHHLTSPWLQTFTAKVNNPSDIALYVYVSTTIDRADGGFPYPVSTQTSTVYLAPGESKIDLTSTYQFTSADVGFKFNITATIYYSPDGVNWYTGNSKSGAIAVA